MNKIIDFFASVKIELSKVVWPSKEQTIRLTAIVIIVTVMVGFFLGIIDFGLTKLLGIVLNK